MSKTTIGILFILAGLAYSSLAIDSVYDHTLGYLVENKWINPPVAQKTNQSALGRKPLILLYGLALIIIGIYLLWNNKI